MQSNPCARLMHYADLLQGTLFGRLEAEVGTLCEKGRLLIAVLEMVPLARQVPCARGWLGRPAKVEHDTSATAAAAYRPAVAMPVRLDECTPDSA